MRALALTVVLMLTACGGGSTTRLCAGTVMGKLMGTFSVCNDFDQRYRANLNTWALTGAYTELPTSFVWSTEWSVKGEPKVGTYNQDSANAECKVTMSKGTPTWLARKGSGVPASGTCQLTLSDITANPQDGNLITYKVKGNISARLEAQPGTGATETVDVSMDFCEGDAALCPAPMP